MTLDEAWAEAEAALPEGSDFGVTLIASGPEAGWYASVLRPAMSMYDTVGPVETVAAALHALAQNLAKVTTAA